MSAEEEYTNFVPAVVARSAAEAEEYYQLLSDHDIPAMIGDEDIEVGKDEDLKSAKRRGMSRGVPVLVPDVMLDEASEVIADREDLDEDEDLGLGEGLDSELSRPLSEEEDKDDLLLEDDEEDEEDLDEFEDDEED